MGGTRHALLASVAGGAYFGYNTAIVSGLTVSIVRCRFFPTSPPSVDETSAQAFYRGAFTACILVGGILGAVAAVPCSHSSASAAAATALCASTARACVASSCRPSPPPARTRVTCA